MNSINRWTLITGASSGIGRALALQFASQKNHIVLVSRDEEKLRALTKIIEEQYGVQTFVIAKDLSVPSAPFEIFKILSENNMIVDCLVNNAGFGVHGEFKSTDLNQELKMVDLQISTLLKLIKLFVPAMIELKSGRILNVASVYAFAPVPQQSVYGACKSFILSFSESLASELKPHGITVTTVCPGATQSEFRTRAGMKEKSKESGMPAEDVAKISYKALMRGQRIVTPGGVNYLFGVLSRHLPRVLLPRIMKKINDARGVNKPH
jgi:short-subunit dehydrogenase